MDYIIEKQWILHFLDIQKENNDHNIPHKIKRIIKQSLCLIPSDRELTFNNNHYNYHTRTYQEYLDIIIENSIASKISMCVSLVYMNRAIKERMMIFNNNDLILIYFVALCIASKYCDDQPFSNCTYSKILRIPLKRFNELEHHFLKILNYECYIDLEYYEEHIDEIFSCEDK